jgi:hypothetical protein
MGAVNTVYVSPNEIIADVSQIVVDEALHDFTYGYWLSQIEQGLSEIAFDSFFDKKHFTALIPSNLKVPLPDDFYVAEQVFLFNGNECTVNSIGHDTSSAMVIRTSAHRWVATTRARYQNLRCMDRPQVICASSTSWVVRYT